VFTYPLLWLVSQLESLNRYSVNSKALSACEILLYANKRSFASSLTFVRDKVRDDGEALLICGIA
jgi:hypothetical protein